MEQPLVSIVIPLYNQQLRFFQPALESALNQTYPNVEVVVSDNHSTNEVPAWLAMQQHSRLRIVKPPEFLPMVRHFQYAADQATGDYISLLCSDDWLHLTHLEKLMPSLLTDPQAVAAYCEIETVDYLDLNRVRLHMNRRPTGTRAAAESLTELLNARPFFAWIPGGVMRRDAYDQVRLLLNGAITYAFDLALLFKLHELGCIIYLNEPLAKFRSWTDKEGKLGGARLLENIADMGQLCRLLEDSPALVSLLPNGRQAIAMWRAYQAKRWVLALLLGIMAGTINATSCREGVAMIRQTIWPNPTGANALLRLLGQPQLMLARPLLNALYKVYLFIQYRTRRAY